VNLGPLERVGPGGIACRPGSLRHDLQPARLQPLLGAAVLAEGLPQLLLQRGPLHLQFLVGQDLLAGGNLQFLELLAHPGDHLPELLLLLLDLLLLPLQAAAVQLGQLPVAAQQRAALELPLAKEADVLRSAARGSGGASCHRHIGRPGRGRGGSRPAPPPSAAA